MRQTPNFIESYLEYTEHQESPELFHRAVALAIMSFAVERNVKLFRGYWTLYPNLYVFLVSSSGSTRRSIACKCGMDLFEKALPQRKVFAQKCSAQALIKSLHDEYKEHKKSSIILYADEIINMFQKEDIDLLGLVTKLYDCSDEFSYETIARGKEFFKYGWCGALWSSAPDWLKLALPAVAIGGGFTSRLLIVYSTGTERRIPRPERYITPKFDELKSRLINDLQHISKIKGSIEWSKEGEEWYDDWYMMIYKPDTDNTHMVGYYGRKHELLIKIAILLKISKSDDLILEVDELEEALELINEYEKQIPGILQEVGSSEMGGVGIRVSKFLEEKKVVQHSKLLQRFSYKLSAKELADIVQTLEQEDKIKVELKEGKLIYYWKGRGYDIK